MIDTMYPILARYGSIFIYSYTVVMALGVIAAIFYSWRMARERAASQWFDALLVIFGAALIAGRAGFIGGHWDYFQEHLTEIWQIGQGGLSYPAAMLAGLTALLLWSAFQGRSFYRYAAVFAPALLLVSIFGWSACWLEGCAYGRETVLGWMASALPDEYGVIAVRYRTQLFGALLTASALLLLIMRRRRLTDAQLFLLALVAVSLIHLLISTMRGDPSPVLGPWRLDAWLSGLLVILSLLLLQYEQQRARQMKGR